MSEANIQKIHDASMRILSTTGMKFHHPDAIKILKDHGIRMEGNVAYFTEEQIMTWLKKAPSSFEMHAVNSKYNAVIGGWNVVNAPAAGPTQILEPDGTVREAEMSDVIKMEKLYEQCDDILFNGGDPCQPKGMDAITNNLILVYVGMTHSEKLQWTGCSCYRTMESIMKMAMARYHLTEEEFKKTPCLFTAVNTTTPLQLDLNMTESLLTYAKYRQPVAVSPACMGGTTAPVTIAGALALTNAEILATIALAEMYSEGCPVLYGSQNAIADMGTCAIATGSPEGAIFYKYCGEMARFYGIPCRSGGSLTDAKVLNAQAGYESMMTYHACNRSGINIVLQSAGILDGYLKASYEKMIVDFEIIASVKRYERDIEVNEETLAEDLIDEVGIGGNYLLEDHTLENFRKECMLPKIGVRGPNPHPNTAFEDNIQKRIDQMLASYKQPEIDPETLEKMHQVLRDAGVTDEYIAQLDQY